MTSANTPEVRRFSLLDIMILVVAIAVGLAWARFHVTLNTFVFSPFSPSDPSFVVSMITSGSPPTVVNAAWVWGKYALAAQVMATIPVGLLIIRYRQSRSSFRLAVREPSLSACAAVSIVLILSPVRFFIDLVRWKIEIDFQRSMSSAWYIQWWECAYDIIRPCDPGTAILSCWGILALSGQMQRGRSLCDRLGWIVAAYWIVALVFFWMVGPR